MEPDARDKVGEADRETIALWMPIFQLPQKLEEGSSRSEDCCCSEGVVVAEKTGQGIPARPEAAVQY